MSRLHWAVLLAAIFSITSGLGKLGPRNSPSKLEGVGSASAPGGVYGNIVKVSYRDKLQASVNYSSPSSVEKARSPGGSPSNVEGVYHNEVMGQTAALAPAEGVHRLIRHVSATTSSTATLKLSDLPIGKVIQVGTIKFVKVGADQYLAINLCPDGSTYSSFYKGCVIKTTTFSYKNSAQTFTAPATGIYVVELWGASGGTYSVSPYYGRGAYTRGNLQLNTNSQLYVYTGGQGVASTSNYSTGGYNGGGYSHKNASGYTCMAGGGGGTDIRTVNGAWNNANSLRSRMMVAAGGGGAGYYSTNASSPSNCGSTEGARMVSTGGGGLTANNSSCVQVNSVCNGSWLAATGGTQVSGGYQTNSTYNNTDFNGAFGYAPQTNGTQDWWGPGGGGGWYGGASGGGTGGSGGSSYISGHTGCVAVTSTSNSSPKSSCTTGTTNNSCSITPYINPATGAGYTFTNTVMIDGAGYAWTNTKGSLQQMPSPSSVGTYYASGVGHTGNGAARITQLSVYLGI